MNDKVVLRPDGILNVIVIGRQTDEEVRGSSALSDRLIKEHDLREIRYLVDFSQVGTIVPSARQALRERMKQMETYQDVKYAIIGLTAAVRSLIKLYMRAVRPKSEIRFFEGEQEAVEWLRVNN
jgi:hypothetical protein